eukprot:7804605-Heterocapsa_arctica.AAC.1
MDLMRNNFRSAIYICTASAERWEIEPPSRHADFDEAADEIRHLAREKGLTCCTGASFWDDVRPFKQAKNAYHHGEPGNYNNLVYLWDKWLLDIYLF